MAFLQRPKDNEKKSLFEKVHTISLVFTLNKIPEKQKIDPYKIVLPHPIYSDSTEICLVVGDKKKAEFKEKNLPNIKKLLSIDSLRKKYSSYEARDKLLISYDLFFCDSVVKLPLLQFFGKTFIKAKKYPIPITFHYKVPPAQLVATTRDCTFLYISRGSCINLKIALSSHTTQQITENIVQSLEKVVAKIPGSWEAINRISIKGADSIELPFYAKPEKQ
uniref:Ribosomal protein L1 n=1 Tax=Arcella intermedia TaxID=1963864 RepID=A0A6B2LG60_9EUKA